MLKAAPRVLHLVDAPQQVVRDLSARLVLHARHRCALQRRDAAFRRGVVVRGAASSPLYLRSQFGGLHVRGEQPRKALGIASRHAAFGRDTVDPGMAPAAARRAALPVMSSRCTRPR